MVVKTAQKSQYQSSSRRVLEVVVDIEVVVVVLLLDVGRNRVNSIVPVINVVVEKIVVQWSYSPFSTRSRWPILFNSSSRSSSSGVIIRELVVVVVTVQLQYSQQVLIADARSSSSDSSIIIIAVVVVVVAVQYYSSQVADISSSSSSQQQRYRCVVNSTWQQLHCMLPGIPGMIYTRVVMSTAVSSAISHMSYRPVDWMNMPNGPQLPAAFCFI